MPMFSKAVGRPHKGSDRMVLNVLLSTNAAVHRAESKDFRKAMCGPALEWQFGPWWHIYNVRD